MQKYQVNTSVQKGNFSGNNLQLIREWTGSNVLSYNLDLVCMTTCEKFEFQTELDLILFIF